MSTGAPEVIRVATDDAELGTIRWPGAPGAPVVFALAGVFGNAWVWSSVARHLDGRVALVAVDLRGRGASAEAPGPFGVRRHVADLVHVIRRFNAGPAVAVGHSLGAVVALATADQHPEVDGVVLVEGGPPIPRNDAQSVEEQVDELLRPYAALVERVWPDRVSYEAAFHEVPVLREHWSPEVERYLLSDLVERDDGFRSRINLDAVRRDVLDMLGDDELRTLLDRRATATIVVRAEHGLNAAPPPVIDDAVMHRYHWHSLRTVTGCNVFSILIDDAGAAAVARAIRDEVDATTRR